MSRICAYKNDKIVPHYKCNEPAINENYCLFHTDKPFIDLGVYTEEVAQQRMQDEYQFKIELNRYILASNNEDTYRFIGFVFPYMSWDIVSFDKIVDFRYAVFPQGSSFRNNTIFRMDAYFDNTIMNWVMFSSGSVFKGRTSFNNAVMRNGHINGVTFEDRVSFVDTKFYGNYINLSPSTFKNKVFFTGTIFDKEDAANFTPLNISVLTTEHKVEPTVGFVGSVFEDVCTLENCNFNVVAQFNSVVFKQGIKIYRSKFNKNFDFTSVEIGDETVIAETAFFSNCTFRNAKFLGSFAVIGGVERTFKDVLNFQSLRITKDSSFSFNNTSLDKATFLYTNIEDYKFLDVTWYTNKEKKTLLRKRPQLWDEENFQNRIELYERIADNYRQLVNNYEKKRNFENAEFFHIGEMEIRRKKQRYQSTFGITNKHWRAFRSWFNATGFYWLSSRYGTSYTQAFFVLLLLIFIINPILFLLSGFQTGKEINADYYQTINFNIIPNSTDHLISLPRLIEGYLASLSYIFSIITFQKDRFYVPLDNSWLSQMALYLSVFLLTTQGAFLLLAIRRQFKR